MTLSRISTLNNHQTTLQNATRVQNSLLNTQNQISSGYKADTYQGLNQYGEVELFSQLNDTLTKTQQYISNNQQVSAKLNTTSTVLDQVIDISNGLKNLIMLRRSATDKNSLGFKQQLEGDWQSLAGQLNTRFGNEYIFSGTATDTQPVDTENFPSLVDIATPDDGYYRGNSQDIQTRVQDYFNITSNVRANDPAIQKIFAGLAMAKKGDASNDDALLSKAYDMLQEGINGVITVQAGVNANKVSVTSATDKLQSLQLYWKGLKDSIINTDMIAASTQVSVDQSILQASFQAFAKIVSLKLSDYLR